jgi:hypothetical protein
MRSTRRLKLGYSVRKRSLTALPAPELLRPNLPARRRVWHGLLQGRRLKLKIGRAQKRTRSIAAMVSPMSGEELKKIFAAPEQAIKAETKSAGEKPAQQSRCSYEVNCPLTGRALFGADCDSQQVPPLL